MSVVVLDGAIGTELLRRGFVAEGEAWTARAAVTDRALLESVHAAYAESGATLHTANTFRAQPRLFPDDCERLVRESVRAVRVAVRSSDRVVGSLAPIVDCYRPDLAPPEEISAPLHARMARALADSAVDAILCEGFANPDELRVASACAAATGLPVWAAMTAGPEGSLLTPRALASGLRGSLDHGVERVFVHCIDVATIDDWVTAVAALGVPFGVYANAGDPAGHGGWGRETEEAVGAYGNAARRFRDAGATVIGGCCGTSSRHIAAVVGALNTESVAWNS